MMRLLKELEFTLFNVRAVRAAIASDCRRPDWTEHQKVSPPGSACTSAVVETGSEGGKNIESDWW